jgi:hypothetical protein
MNTFRLIPMHWVSVILNAFHVLDTHMKKQLESGVLESTKYVVLWWMIKFTNDNRITLPEVKGHIFNTLQVLLANRSYIRAAERIPIATSQYIPFVCSLISSEEPVEWRTSLRILRRISMGIGIADVGSLTRSNTVNCTSPVLCESWRSIVLYGGIEKNIQGGEKFLHGLLNRVNW